MAKVRVKASPGRPRTSVPGDTATAMKWVKISFGGKTSRYVVHYHLDDGNDGPLKPICGSKNMHNRSYEKVVGEHVNCTKCITKKGALRLAAANAAMVEARIAQQAKDIEKAAEQVANTKPRSVPPVSTPVAPDLPPLILRPAPAAVPTQRNGVDPALFRAPEFPQPLPPVDDDDDYDEGYDDDADEFDETESAEEAPQMTAPTAPTVTPLTAFPNLPTARPTVAPPAPTPAAPVAAEPEAAPQAAPEPPVEDDVIVVRSNTYDVILTHPVTKVKMVIEGVEASSEEEAELIALDYVEVETVTRTTRVRAPRRR
jgi:hypothetical protein